MTKSPYSYLIFVILTLITGIIFAKYNKFDTKYLLAKKINRYIIIAIIPLLYIVLTSVIVVTEDGIHDYSFYNLKGTKYSFGDVEYVNTGFVDKLLSVVRNEN